jgi:hypothetical protein
LFWLELDRPDSAYTHYASIASSSDSLRPKSLYAATWIARNALKDTALSDSMFKILMSDFPASEFSKKAQKDRGDTITVCTRCDSAAMVFTRAESLFIAGSDSIAAEEYRSVFSAYSDCSDGLRGLYAAAWINDNVMENNKTAFRLYRMMCDSFPQSEMCKKYAHPRLKTVSDSLAARKGKKKSTDTTDNISDMPPGAESLPSTPKPTPDSVAAPNSYRGRPPQTMYKKELYDRMLSEREAAMKNATMPPLGQDSAR